MLEFDDLIKYRTGVSDELSDQAIERLRNNARAEIAQRSGPGTLVVVGAAAVSGFLSGQYKEYPWIFAIAMLAVVISALARFPVIRRFKSNGASHDWTDEPRFFIATLMLPLVWGLYSGLLLFMYHTEIFGVGILVFTAAIAGNVIISFGMWQKLTTWYILVVTGPTLISGLLVNTGLGWAVVVGITISAYYLLAQLRIWNQFFWRSQINTAILEARTNELIVAKENAESANLAKTEFLTRMSHELRTPMNAVLGFAQLIEFTADQPAEARKNGQEICVAGEHLMALIEEILDVSKIEARQLSLESNAVDLAAITKGVIDILRGATHETLELTFEYDDELPAMRGDALRIRQVLVNIIGNAVKFTASGSVKVSLAARDRATVLISVRDTGIGIEAHVIDSMFAPFVQADTSITRRFGGTGLGLPISKSLVELMGGSIKVESVPGQGSNFEVCLPIVMQPVSSALS